MRKAEIILQVLRQTTPVIGVARQTDLMPSVVQGWTDACLKAGGQGLKARAVGVDSQADTEVEELKATIGELFVESEIKKTRLCEGPRRRPNPDPAEPAFGRRDGA